MRRASLWLAAAWSASLVLFTPVILAADKVPAYITAAVNDPARPQADTQRDAKRQPAATLAFAGIKPGQKVAELMAGGGYFTRLLSKAVGPGGHVYAFAPSRRPNAPEGSPDPAAPLNAIAQDPGYSNVSVLPMAFSGDTLGAPEPVDVVWTSLNYHDFHNIPPGDISAFNKRVFDALKPGGIFIVIDHAATVGDGTNDTRTLHRMDPEAAKKELIAAGFKLVGSSDVLRNPNDPHTAPIFDASIRGNTDQFFLKLVKPAK